MVSDPEEFDADLDAFFKGQQDGFANNFFSDVAIPIQTAWKMHKDEEWYTKEGRRVKNTQGAVSLLNSFCKAEDWKIACVEWLKRRLKSQGENNVK
jgi:hypothetical protein